jgi:hypothetical protein
MVLLRLLLRLLFTRIKRLLLARRKRLATDVRLLVVAVVVGVVGVVAARFTRLLLLLEIRLRLPQVLLGGCDQPEIMLGVLIVILSRDRIAGTLRIAGQLEVLLGNVRCIAPDFHVRSIGLVHARQWILVMVMMKTTFTAVATPHALVLPVSHGLLFRQPPSFAAALLPPFPFIALPLSSSITNVIGAHCQKPRSEPPANASMQTSRNLSNAALTIGSAAVSHTRRHARQGFVPTRAQPINFSVRTFTV